MSLNSIRHAVGATLVHWRIFLASRLPLLNRVLRFVFQPWRIVDSIAKRVLPHRPKTAREQDVNRAPEVGSIVSIEGIRVRLDERLSAEMRAIVASGRHTRPERRLILDALEPDDIVMELGGGIGMLSIACAQRIGSEKVFSYEANPYMKALVDENYALNSVCPTMSYCMVGPQAGEQEFHVSNTFRESSVYDVGKTAKVISVPVKPIDAEIDQIGATFLLVDIEGAEDVLLPSIDFNKLRKVMLETHPEILGIRKSNALRRSIRRHGFSERTLDYRRFLYERV